jgi:hypothetical protein
MWLSLLAASAANRAELRADPPDPSSGLPVGDDRAEEGRQTCVYALRDSECRSQRPRTEATWMQHGETVLAEEHLVRVN